MTPSSCRAPFLTRDAPRAKEVAEGWTALPVAEETRLAQLPRGLDGADLIAPFPLEAFLEMKVDGVEVVHEILGVAGRQYHGASGVGAAEKNCMDAFARLEGTERTPAGLSEI